MKITITAIFIVFSAATNLMAGPGKLLVVGGGSEQDNAPNGNNPGGWSNSPYKWAVDKSVNKRVAIIGNSSNTDFLPDYFKTKGGAIAARNFTITGLNADLQITYDSLITYDVIFFRGGDQSYYYNNYKNTKTFQAIKDKFDNGGVIAGTSAGLHILSSICYAALNSSAVPYTALQNVRSTDITLKSDFFDFFPEYVFDSHVAERGRFPRTISFLGRWFLEKNQKIKALAVDDLTAIGIDENNVGEVFGTGSIGLYQSVARSQQAFRTLTNNKLTADSIKITQLINGWKYDFNTNTLIKPTVTGGYKISNPATKTENSPLTILLGGNNSISQNTSLLGHFVNEVGQPSETIYIISSADTNVANGAKAIKTALLTTSVGASFVKIMVNNSVESQNYYATGLATASKILFVNNTMPQLNAFLSTTGAGIALKSRFTVPGVTFAFWGSDSRFAGKTALAENYLTGSSYSDQILTSKGLELLKNSFIVPNGLAENVSGRSTSMENTATEVTFHTLKDTAAFGILIPGFVSGATFVKYAFSTLTGETFFSSYGAVPALIFKNDGTTYLPSSTTSFGNGTQQPRQVAGFDSLYLSLVDQTNPIKVGNFDVSNINAIPSKITIRNSISSPILVDSSFYIIVDIRNSDNILTPLLNDVEINTFVVSGENGLFANVTFLGQAGMTSITLSGLKFSNTATGIVLSVTAYNFIGDATNLLTSYSTGTSATTFTHTFTFTIYPNPTTSYINMKTTQLFNAGKVSLIDYTGKLVYESDEPTNQVPVFGLPKGIYVLMVNDGEKVYRSKVVIE